MFGKMHMFSGDNDLSQEEQEELQKRLEELFNPEKRAQKEREASRAEIKAKILEEGLADQETAEVAATAFVKFPDGDHDPGFILEREMLRSVHLTILTKIRLLFSLGVAKTKPERVWVKGIRTGLVRIPAWILYLGGFINTIPLVIEAIDSFWDISKNKNGILNDDERKALIQTVIKEEVLESDNAAFDRYIQRKKGEK